MKFGIDIGGTTIKIGMFDGNNLIETYSIDLNFNSAEELVDEIYDFLSERTDNIESIGIGCPGFIVNNFISSSANIHILDKVNLVEIFKKKTNARVRLINDANAAALGEAKYCGYDDLLFITLGTGVGGGLVVKGKFLEGVNGAGMEIGHLKVDEKFNFECGCGQRGCLETISSATGLVRVAEHLYDKFETHLVKPFSAKAIFDWAKKGDSLALAATSIMFDTLGKALANTCILTDPGIIMLGGGVSNAGEFLRRGVEASFKKYANQVVKDTKIVLATLGDKAGIYGAYYRGLEEN